jgi:hypothetical protein
LKKKIGFQPVNITSVVLDTAGYREHRCRHHLSTVPLLEKEVKKRVMFLFLACIRELHHHHRALMLLLDDGQPPATRSHCCT